MGYLQNLSNKLPLLRLDHLEEICGDVFTRMPITELKLQKGHACLFMPGEKFLYRDSFEIAASDAPGNLLSGP